MFNEVRKGGRAQSRGINQADRNEPIETHPPLTGNLRLIYSSYWPELCRYVNAKFGSGPPEPADVAQTAFTRFASLEDPEKIKNPKAFLYATARNIVMDYKRQEKTAQNYTQSILHHGEDNILNTITPEHVLQEKEILQLMSKVIQKLPRKQRRVLLLHRLHNLTYTEIARRMKLSQSDVRRQMAQAVEVLEEAIEKTNEPRQKGNR